MIKMLIIDDEYLVRMGIRETIDWESNDIEIIGEATNGKQGLQMVMELNPDIIISDIKMPVMDGMELSKELKSINFDGSIIILSGYSDFDYARQAIDSDVFSYLLKPINNEELLNKVLEAKSALMKKREENSRLKLYQEDSSLLKGKIVNDYLKGIESEKIEDKLKLFNFNYIRKGTIIYCEIEEDDAVNEIENNLIKLYDMIQKALRDYECLGNVYSSYFVIVTGCTYNNLVTEEIKKVIAQHEKTNDSTATIGISEAFNSINDIPKRFAQAKDLVLNRQYKMLNMVLNKDSRTLPYKKLVVDIINYITKNFNKNITIKTVADDLFISESHLMHLFKEDLGKTFNDYLTNYRIMKAKELLAKGAYRVNEVAYMVGYGDEKYFGQVFKKITGLTPSMYANK